jgi:hypothetical protein
MCLIIHQPKGHTLSHAMLRDIFARNDDGFGVMRAHKGALHTHRSVPATADAMIALYQQHAAGRECVLHWRVATHGAVDASNAHPFHLTRDIAVMHNGIVDCGTPTRGMSDTWHMAHHVLAPMARDNADALFTHDVCAVMEPLVRGSKLAFMHADGRVMIWNRSAGVEHGGLWFSNTYGWAAPAHLHTHAPRAWHDAKCAGLSLDADDAYDVPDFAEWGEADDAAYRALATACDTQAELGALRWAESHPVEACTLLSEWTGLSTHEAREVLDTEPLTAADWLYEMAS